MSNIYRLLRLLQSELGPDSSFLLVYGNNGKVLSSGLSPEDMKGLGEHIAKKGSVMRDLRNERIMAE